MMNKYWYLLIPLLLPLVQLPIYLYFRNHWETRDTLFILCMTMLVFMIVAGCILMGE